jgi:hypothetical protein
MLNGMDWCQKNAYICIKPKPTKTKIVMKWEEIKKSIVDGLMPRELADPNIRIGALGRVERIMEEYYPLYIKDPNELIWIDKDTFKREIAERKGRDLNDAEKSIINEIYRRINMTEWINRTLDSSLNDEDFEPIYYFSLLWNLFEGKLFATNFCLSQDTTKRKIQDICSQLNNGDNNIVNTTFNHFKHRYVSDGNTNDGFDSSLFLDGRNEDLKNEAREILLKTEPSMMEKLKSLVIIIYRLRNNLFHANKELRFIDGQRCNFVHANQFLKMCIEKHDLWVNP